MEALYIIALKGCWASPQPALLFERDILHAFKIKNSRLIFASKLAEELVHA